MPFRPEYPGEIPTLGFTALRWMRENLVVPDGPLAGAPLVYTREQAQFLINFYRLDPLFEPPVIRGASLVNARAIRRAILSRPKGWGKALALDTPVPTPSGWSTIGDLAPDDIVFDGDGCPTRVLAVSPTWIDTDCWRVRLSDGAEFTASGDHLWAVDELARGYRADVVDTRTLAARRTTRADGAANFRIQSPPPLQLADAALPLDPYVLGVWLGDGERAGQRITGVDAELFGFIRDAGFRVRELGQARWSVLGLAAPLRAAGVFKVKHIPASYLRSSAGQRLALLQGLMDTDGSVYGPGTCEFTTTTAALRDGVSELLSSLGVKHSIYSGVARLDGRDCGPKWRVKFTVHDDLPVFRLARKRSRLRPRVGARELHRTRRIVAVDRVETVPTRCIEVAARSHLFLVGRSMVPTHNSPILASIAIFEALGPAICDGWDANGRPVGVPWTHLGFKAKAQIIATSEDQTSNTWDPLLDMIRNGPLANDPGVEPMETFVRCPRGRIEFATSSANSREGGRPVFASLDQTESWVESNGGKRLAAAVRRNLTKTQGSSIESPNAYRPGMESVAEGSFTAAAQQKARKTRGGGILLDHREAPADTDPEDLDSLMAGLAYAYGESADVNGGWVDLSRIAEDYYDPDTEPQDARMYYLGQVTHAATSWLSHPEWTAAFWNPVDRGPIPLADGDMVTIGFDGSRKRARGVVDATALIGCHVLTGYTFEIGVWEQPDGEQGKGWEIPRPEVMAAVRAAFERWHVVGFHADPARWETEVAGWEASYGRRLLVKATQQHPIEWWMTGGRTGQIVKAVAAFEHAVREGTLTHDGGYAYTRHVLNARRKETPSGITLSKEHPDSRRKIDAAVAGVLANWARVGAVAAGLARPRGKRKAYGF